MKWNWCQITRCLVMSWLGKGIPQIAYGESILNKFRYKADRARTDMPECQIKMINQLEMAEREDLAKKEDRNDMDHLT